MNKIFLYEEFIEKTLTNNINKYNTYLDTDDRSAMVAWEANDSQIKNFSLVASHIKNGDTILDYGCGVGDFIKYLEVKDIKINDYLGVDINDNYIEIAKKSYVDHNFKLIKDVNQIPGKWDDVCVIGVFTWYITKNEFIETINRLHNLCNKQVLLTVLQGETPYKRYIDEEEEYWDEEYRYYDEDLFITLFPDLNITFEYNKNTMLVKIEK